MNEGSGGVSIDELPWCNFRRRPLEPRGCKVARYSNSWESYSHELFNDLKHFPFLGFDIEWISKEHQELFAISYVSDGFEPYPKDDVVASNVRAGRVALVQLSTFTGYTVLLRACYLRDLPPSFLQLMRNPDVLKVGVGIVGDRKKLATDWKVEMQSVVDLRYVVERMSEFEPGCRLSLKAIACHLFGREKNWDSHRLKRSDWSVEWLTEDQIMYAARDSVAAIDVFTWGVPALLRREPEQRRIWENELCAPSLHADVFHAVRRFINAEYSPPDDRGRGSRKNNNNNANSSSCHPNCPLHSGGANNRFPPGGGGGLEDEDPGGLQCSRDLTNFLMDPRSRTNPQGSNLLLTFRNAAGDGVFAQLDYNRLQHIMSAGGRLEHMLVNAEGTRRLLLHLEDTRLPEELRQRPCVVCGAVRRREELSIFGIVPDDYRAHYEPKYYGYCECHYVLLCGDCLVHAHQFEIKLRKVLAEYCRVPLRATMKADLKIDQPLRAAKLKARQLLNFGPVLTTEEKMEAYRVVLNYHGITEPVTYETKIPTDMLETTIQRSDLVYAEETDVYVHEKNVIGYFAKLYQGRVKDAYQAFEHMWRTLFAKILGAVKLPESWKPVHDLSDCKTIKRIEERQGRGLAEVFNEMVDSRAQPSTTTESQSSLRPKTPPKTSSNEREEPVFSSTPKSSSSSNFLLQPVMTAKFPRKRQEYYRSNRYSTPGVSEIMIPKVDEVSIRLDDQEEDSDDSESEEMSNRQQQRDRTTKCYDSHSNVLLDDTDSSTSSSDFSGAVGGGRSQVLRELARRRSLPPGLAPERQVFAGGYATDERGDAAFFVDHRQSMMRCGDVMRNGNNNVGGDPGAFCRMGDSLTQLVRPVLQQLQHPGGSSVLQQLQHPGSTTATTAASQQQAMRHVMSETDFGGYMQQQLQQRAAANTGHQGQQHQQQSMRGVLQRADAHAPAVHLVDPTTMATFRDATQQQQYTTAIGPGHLVYHQHQHHQHSTPSPPPPTHPSGHSQQPTSYSLQQVSQKQGYVASHRPQHLMSYSGGHQQQQQHQVMPVVTQGGAPLQLALAPVGSGGSVYAQPLVICTPAGPPGGPNQQVNLYAANWLPVRHGFPAAGPSVFRGIGIPPGYAPHEQQAPRQGSNNNSNSNNSIMMPHELQYKVQQQQQQFDPQQSFDAEFLSRQLGHQLVLATPLEQHMIVHHTGTGAGDHQQQGNPPIFLQRASPPPIHDRSPPPDPVPAVVTSGMPYAGLGGNSTAVCCGPSKPPGFEEENSGAAPSHQSMTHPPPYVVVPEQPAPAVAPPRMSVPSSIVSSRTPTGVGGGSSGCYPPDLVLGPIPPPGCPSQRVQPRGGGSYSPGAAPAFRCRPTAPPSTTHNVVPHPSSTSGLVSSAPVPNSNTMLPSVVSTMAKVGQQNGSVGGGEETRVMVGGRGRGRGGPAAPPQPPQPLPEQQPATALLVVTQANLRPGSVSPQGSDSDEVPPPLEYYNSDN